MTAAATLDFKAVFGAGRGTREQPSRYRDPARVPACAHTVQSGSRTLLCRLVARGETLGPKHNRRRSARGDLRVEFYDATATPNPGNADGFGAFLGHTTRARFLDGAGWDVARDLRLPDAAVAEMVTWVSRQHGWQTRYDSLKNA